MADSLAPGETKTLVVELPDGTPAEGVTLLAGNGGALAIADPDTAGLIKVRGARVGNDTIRVQDAFGNTGSDDVTVAAVSLTVKLV